MLAHGTKGSVSLRLDLLGSCPVELPGSVWTQQQACWTFADHTTEGQNEQQARVKAPVSPATPRRLGQTKLQAETILCEETGTCFWDRGYALSDSQAWTSAAQQYMQ